MLQPLVDWDEPVALVSFPNHANPGDNALWLGAEAALRRQGARIVFRSNWKRCDIGTLRRRLGRGTIILQGGGNLGDLYRGQQDLRVELLATQRGVPILQLPQSIWFADPENAASFARLVRGHGATPSSAGITRAWSGPQACLRSAPRSAPTSR